MEIKQLKYFVVAADVGSFSEAAHVLFTTQSSVSKVILSLEKELGFPLFQRESKGISLTDEGKKFHEKANQLVNDFEALEVSSIRSGRDTVRISTNHSSWLANCFSEFYELNKHKDLCYLIHADDTPNIINRLKHMEDELGFVYVFPDTKVQFEYEIKKNQLVFEELKSIDGMIFFQPDDVNNGSRIDESMIDSLKFIQSEKDEYLNHGTWYTNSGNPVNISDNIAVITNSDYVMHSLLKNNSLANVSAGSFNSFSGGINPGIKLKNSGGQIRFGILTNKNATISKEAGLFAEFIREKF